MSQENLEQLRRLYRTRTFEEFAESLHPDAEMHQAREVPDVDDYHGREEFVRGTRRWLEEWTSSSSSLKTRSISGSEPSCA
jgi:hypothetical protein